MTRYTVERGTFGDYFVVDNVRYILIEGDQTYHYASMIVLRNKRGTDFHFRTRKGAENYALALNSGKKQAPQLTNSFADSVLTCHYKEDTNVSATEYNGWTNYETWVVNLWVTNTEYDNTEKERLAATISNKRQLAAAIKCWVISGMGNNQFRAGYNASLIHDLSGRSRLVNWEELAEIWRSDYEAEQRYQDSKN